MQPAPYPTANAHLHNNPRFRHTLYNPVKREEIVFEALPWIEVIWRDLPQTGSWDVGFTVLDRSRRELASFDSQATCEAGCLRWALDLDSPLPDPWAAHLWARQGSSAWEETVGLRAYALSGRITGFDGQPRQAVVAANGLRGIATAADEAGKYRLSLPDRHIPSLIAADAEFGRESVECWVYDYRPSSDLTLDLRIGEIELYELHAWRGYAGIKVDFIPMSIGVINARIADRSAAGPWWPELSPADITVELDAAPVEILAMDRRDEVLGDAAERDLGVRSRGEYALQLADPPSPPGQLQILRVTVRHELEQGEGFFLGLTPGLGVSGRRGP